MIPLLCMIIRKSFLNISKLITIIKSDHVASIFHREQLVSLLNLSVARAYASRSDLFRPRPLSSVLCSLHTFQHLLNPNQVQ